MNDTRTNEEGTHTILVAVEISAPTADQAEEWLAERLRHGIGYHAVWWIAEDDRHDGSDNDSAIFVPMGSQTRFARFVTSVRDEVEDELIATRNV